MEDVNHFFSKDFYLVAVCLACGCHLMGLDRSQGDYVEFILKETPEHCHGIISSYWADELEVNPRHLVDAINTLKTRLHSRI